MISGTNLVTGRKSEYTYNGLLARVKKASDAIVSTYIPDYIGGIHNDLVTQVSGLGTVNAAFAHGYSRASQRFTPEAGVSIPAADTYFQHDLYGSPLFAADADGMIKHRADHDLWGMPKNACEDSAISAGLRFTTYEYDPVLEKHFAHARLYDPAQGRMLGTDPVKRGLNGYAYCGNDPVNHTDPTGEIANILLGGFAGGIIGGAFGFAGSALSQLAEGKGFNARKAWGAAANGAIVGAARGALTGSGVGIPAALGVNFAAGMAGSLAEQRLAGERMSPVRAAVDGAFNALGGRIYGTSPLRNAKDAFIRGALEGAVKGGAYNIADVLDNKLRNAYGPKKPAVRKPQNLRGVQPTRSRCPQKECEKARPFAGMKYAGKDGRGGSLAPRNDRFSLGRFVRDVAVGAVMGGLASVAFYGAGKGVEALRNSVQRKIRKPVFEGSLSLVFGDDDAIRAAKKIALPTTRDEFIVISHGEPYGIIINGKVEKAWEVAIKIRRSKEFIGGHQIIKLYSCETGKEPDGFAQQLADILGVMVMAPDKNVHPLGNELKVGYKYINMKTGLYAWDPGKWNEFSPNVKIFRHKSR